LALTDKKLFWDCFFCLSRACKLKLLQLFHHLMLAVIFITSHVYVARWTLRNRRAQRGASGTTYQSTFINLMFQCVWPPLSDAMTAKLFVHALTKSRLEKRVSKKVATY